MGRASPPPSPACGSVTCHLARDPAHRGVSLHGRVTLQVQKSPQTPWCDMQRVYWTAPTRAAKGGGSTPPPRGSGAWCLHHRKHLRVLRGRCTGLSGLRPTPHLGAQLNTRPQHCLCWPPPGGHRDGGAWPPGGAPSGAGGPRLAHGLLGRCRELPEFRGAELREGRP